MPLYSAPAGDLVDSRIPDDPFMRRELAVRWGTRVLGQHAPAVLRQLGHETAASELQVLASAELDESWVATLLERCRDLHARLRTSSDRDHDELVDMVLGCARATADAIGVELGVRESVIAVRNDISGPWTVIDRSEDKQLEDAKSCVLALGRYARTIAHVAGGQRGYRAEVAQQYAELYPGGDVVEFQPSWGKLVAGKRYRVFSEITDLDGVRHRWGESWRFDGCTFSPTTCVVRLVVSEGVQLDKLGRPGPRIEVAPFRIAVEIGDRPARNNDVIDSSIDTDLTEWKVQRPAMKQEASSKNPDDSRRDWTGWVLEETEGQRIKVRLGQPLGDLELSRQDVLRSAFGEARFNVFSSYNDVIEASGLSEERALEIDRTLTAAGFHVEVVVERSYFAHRPDGWRQYVDDVSIQDMQRIADEMISAGVPVTKKRR